MRVRPRDQRFERFEASVARLEAHLRQIWGVRPIPPNPHFPINHSVPGQEDSFRRAVNPFDGRRFEQAHNPPWPEILPQPAGQSQTHSIGILFRLWAGLRHLFAHLRRWLAP